MKKIITLLVLVITLNSYSQAMVVTDIELNVQMTALNTATDELAALASDKKLLDLKSYEESITQGKVLYDELSFLKEVEENLEKVSAVLKNFHLLESSMMYSLKTFQSYRNIITKMNKLSYFKISDIERLIDIVSPILEENNQTISQLKTILKDNAIKTDQGLRLQLLLKLNKGIKANYNKVYQIELLLNDMVKNTTFLED